MKELLKHLDNVGKRNYHSPSMDKWSLKEGFFSIVRVVGWKKVFILRTKNEVKKTYDFTEAIKWFNTEIVK